MSLLDKIFGADEEVDLSELYGTAQKFLNWAEDEACERLLDRLDEEASRPLKVGEQTAMIESAVRANTLREVADWLKRDIRQARRDLVTCRRELSNG